LSTHTWAKWLHWMQTSSQCWHGIGPLSWCFSPTKILKRSLCYHCSNNQFLPTKVLNGFLLMLFYLTKYLIITFIKYLVVYFLLLCPYNKNKFYFYSSMCLFLRYSPQSKGYICLSSNAKVYISWHVIFNEYYFHYATSANPFL